MTSFCFLVFWFLFSLFFRHLRSILPSPPPAPLPVRFEHRAWGGGGVPASAPALSPQTPPCSPFPTAAGPGSGPDPVLGPLRGPLPRPAPPQQSPVSAEREAVLLLLPLVVCLLNLGGPYLFRILAALERHDSPVLEVYVAICRNLILKMVTLGILCYHWLGRRVGTLKDQCWENFVGQELYRLMVMDFIFTLLDTLLGELVWRLFSEKQLKRKGKPEFDIAGNVLELIYGQTLTWLGVLFSPLLPAMQIIKLLLLFYIKKASLMANCQAPRRPWKASHMSTVFISLLCFPSFLGAAVFLCYAVWQVKPSSTCGPFRTLDTMYEAGKVWVRRLEKAGPRVSWLPWIHRYLVEDTFPIYLVSALLLAVIYLNIQVVKGQRKVICLLKEQISNEGEDKIFLINKLQRVYERKEKSRAGRTEEAVTPPALLTDGWDAQ